jgi:small subunit ribosomal protein S6
MQKYEIMAIVKNSLDKAAAEKLCQDVIIKKINELGGKTTFEDFWGERGFAYKIDGEKWGYYFVVQFDMEGEKTIELRRDLNIEKGIVRFLTTKVEKNQKNPRKYSEVKAEYEAQEKSSKPEEEKPAKVSREKLTTIEEKQEPTPKKDAVDKKLDDIVADSSKDL